MQSHSQLNSADRPRILPLVLLLAAAVVFLVSCGPNIIKGRPPFISISSMSLIDDRLAADFDIRNQNGVPMNISMIDITVTVNGVQLTRENREFELLIGANSVEEVNAG